MDWTLAALVAFLCGSLPFGLWVGKLARGIDVREHGSGNLGATNVYRTLGPRWGLLVFALDLIKGAVAVVLARALVESSCPPWPGLAGMMAAALGHMFSPFARFKGGKGVATAAGSWLALSPWATLAVIAVWAGTFGATRVVSLASILAAALLPFAVFAACRSFEDPRVWLAAVTAFLIVFRHRSNLTRIRQGQEKQLDVRGPTPS